MKGGARNFARDAIEEIQRELNALRRMVRHKTACEEFGCRAACRYGELLIAGAVRKEINTSERRAIRRGDTCIAVPGSAVHADLVILGTQNDGMGAEDSYSWANDPQA